MGLENLLLGFSIALTPFNLLVALTGIMLGTVIGVLPGLGGANGVAILLPLTFTMPPTSAIILLTSIYWGALVKGTTYGLNDAPWNTNTLELFEAHARKKPSILHWGQSWWDCYSTCDYQRFDYQVEQYNLVRERGYIPLVDWASWDYTIKEQLEQPNFSLRTIIEGRHDDFLRQWAGEARRWGQPFPCGSAAETTSEKNVSMDL